MSAPLNTTPWSPEPSTCPKSIRRFVGPMPDSWSWPLTSRLRGKLSISIREEESTPTNRNMGSGPWKKQIDPSCLSLNEPDPWNEGKALLRLVKQKMKRVAFFSQCARCLEKDSPGEALPSFDLLKPKLFAAPQLSRSSALFIILRFHQTGFDLGSEVEWWTDLFERRRKAPRIHEVQFLLLATPRAGFHLF